MLPCLLSLLDYSDFEEYSTTWTFNANIICNNLGGQKQNKNLPRQFSLHLWNVVLNALFKNKYIKLQKKIGPCLNTWFVSCKNRSSVQANFFNVIGFDNINLFQTSLAYFFFFLLPYKKTALCENV